MNQSIFSILPYLVTIAVLTFLLLKEKDRSSYYKKVVDELESDLVDEYHYNRLLREEVKYYMTLYENQTKGKIIRPRKKEEKKDGNPV